MIFAKAHLQHPDYRVGMLDAVGVATGIAAWGLMTGVAMMQSGLDVLPVLLMAVLVYAGSAQLAAIPLLLADAPMWVILTTGFCVNLRFVVFSAHLRPYFVHLPRWQRILVGYFTGDMGYVLFTRRFSAPGANATELASQQAYLAGCCGISWVAWVASCVVGVLLANLVPLAWGLGFAGILALVGVMCSLVTSRMRALAAVVAATAAVLAYGLPFKLNILVGIGAAVSLCLSLEPLLVSKKHRAAKP